MKLLIIGKFKILGSQVKIGSMKITSKMSKENILKTIEELYNETHPYNLGRLYTLNELVMRLNPQPSRKSSYVKKGASKILKQNADGNKI